LARFWELPHHIRMMYNSKSKIMKNFSKIALVLGLTLSLSQVVKANGNFPRAYESNIKIDRIQVNKMKALKREFQLELDHHHIRDARFIKYEIVELLEKDIRFQKKKIRDIQILISDNDNPYYRKSKKQNNNRRGNSTYYPNNHTSCDNNNIDVREAKRELRVLKRQLNEKRDLLSELNHTSYHSPRALRQNVHLIREVIRNMKADIDLYYNTNIDSPYYRKGR